MQHLIVPIFLACLLKNCSGADWCYQSQFSCDHQCNAPVDWNKANGDCGGKAQSPINIVTKKALKDERLKPFQFSNYQHTFFSSIVNNGHSVQVVVNNQASITSGNLETGYKAVQFHLHWGSNGGPGSEHTIDGEQYPMELHIVHMKQKYSDLKTALNDKTGVAVLGFFYEESPSTNRKYDPIITSLKKITASGSNTTLGPISLDQLIPTPGNLTSYYRYQGSLTTPGCTESVVWTVFEKPIPLSKEQLRVFSELKFHGSEPMVGTFRPVQPLNGRMVYWSGSNVVFASAALLAASVAMAMGLSQPN